MIYVIKEVEKMTVYVTVDVCKGVVNYIQAFLTEKSARKIEKAWLQRRDIKDETSRECEAQNGIELIIYKCNLKL